MKKTTLLITIVAGLAVQTIMAADPNIGPSASANNPAKPTLSQQVTKYLQSKTTTTQTDKIERVGGVSSRPWSQTAASYSAAGPALFAGDRERFHDVQFSLFTFGGKPD